jgi:hypothetical protein
MTKRLALRIGLAMAFTMLHPNHIWAQTDAVYAPSARIEESSLSGLISSPTMWSFDLSSDGKTVALLVVAGSNIGAPLWLVTEDVAAGRVIASHELGSSVFPAGGFAPQLRYTNDRRHLVVQDLRTIQVFDSKSLEPIRTIPPPSDRGILLPLFIAGATNSDVFVCSFGTEQKFNPHFHTIPVQVEVVDVSSGAVLGEWASEDVPQSISPNGDLVAVSSLQAQHGVLPLSVVDVHGQKVAELTGGYSFKDADQSKPLGRVLGLFVGNQELLLTPDENIDQTGHPSGDSLQLVSVSGKQVQVQQSIKPRHYGPQGELAVSADGQTVLAVSWYVPARLLARPHARLPASSPDLLVFGRSVGLHVDAILPIQGLGLKASGWLENRRPRASSDGSVIAVAQRSGVTVLSRILSPASIPKRRAATDRLESDTPPNRQGPGF